ncbi:hypothetical protein D3C83_84680 [compost metagenome]
MVGDAVDELDERGRRVTGETLIILLNAHLDDVPFVLPKVDEGQSWLRAIDTIDAKAPETRFNGGTRYPLQGLTLAVFTLSGERRTRRATDRIGTA